MLQLDERQEKDANEWALDAPPARVFTMRASRNANIKKVKHEISDSDRSDNPKVNIKKLSAHRVSIGDSDSEVDTRTSLINKCLFRKNEFLAVRSENDGFYLYQLKEDINNRIKKFSIRWLTQSTSNKRLYPQDYIDTIYSNTLLTKVKMAKFKNKYGTSEKERRRVIEILKLSLEYETRRKSRKIEAIQEKCSLRRLYTDRSVTDIKPRSN